MRRSCVCVLLLLSGALALPSPTADDLTSNDYYSWIFVVGEDGYVVKTSDAGATWQCSLCGEDRMALTQGATLNADVCLDQARGPRRVRLSGHARSVGLQCLILYRCRRAQRLPGCITFFAW